MGFVYELLEVIQTAQMLVKFFKILCPVSMVSVLLLFVLRQISTPGRCNIKVDIVYDWRNPYCIDAKVLQVIQFLCDSLKVTAMVRFQMSALVGFSIWIVI